VKDPRRGRSFLIFFLYVHTRGGGGFELVTSASLEGTEVAVKRRLPPPGWVKVNRVDPTDA
jgi:hypothetical protein